MREQIALTNPQIINIILVIFVILFVAMMVEIVFGDFLNDLFSDEEQPVNQSGKYLDATAFKMASKVIYDNDFHFEDKHPYINITSDLNYHDLDNN